MRKTNLFGAKEDIACIACSDTLSGAAENNSSLIAETKYFRAEQDYEVPIPGFVIIASKRHFYRLDEMTRQERQDYAEFVYKVRKTMRLSLEIDYIQLFLNEHTASSHFHL